MTGLGVLTLRTAGDPHSDKCFTCRLANGLLECRQCSRSYHPGCLNPPLEPQNTLKLDTWPCPACTLLDAHGATHVYRLDLPYERQDHREMILVDTPSNSGLLQASTPKQIPQTNTSREIGSPSRTDSRDAESRSRPHTIDLQATTTPTGNRKQTQSDQYLATKFRHRSNTT